MSLADRVRSIVVGKKVARVMLNRFPDGRGGYTYDPILVFENGVRMAFIVDEVEDGSSYGITPVVTDPE